MQIEKEKLIGVLTSIKPGLSKKDIIEQATHFIFTGKEILTYNDRICIIHPFKTDFTCSVPSEELYKILSSIGEAEIDLSFKDNNIIIKGKKFEASLATDTGDQILERVDLLSFAKADKKKQKLPDDFVEALTLCMFSASKDATRPAMTGVLVDGKYVASTDGFRISEYKMKSEVDSAEVILPSSSVMELVKFDPKYLYIDKSWAYFINNDGVIFCCMTIADEYPDYVKFLKGFDTKEIVLPENTKQIIETVSVLATGNFDLEKEIDIKIESNKFSCRGQNAKGWIVSNCKIDYDGEPVEFTINPFFLSKILDHTSSMFLGAGKLLFKDKSFKHIISLVSR